MLSAICFDLDKSKILSSGNGLKCLHGSEVSQNYKHRTNTKISIGNRAS